MNTVQKVSCDRNVALFIDVQNLFYAGRCDKSMRVDYRCLIKEAVSGRSLMFARAYCPVHPLLRSSQQLFIESLKRMGVQVFAKDCLVGKNSYSLKGNLDVEISSDITEKLHSKTVGTIILASGDGDFVFLGDKAHKLGKRFEIVSFESALSSRLSKVADKVTLLSEKHTFKVL